MSKFKYLGPSDEVEIPDAGVSVKRGETVDIEDEEIAKSLAKQGECWEQVQAKSAAKKESDR